MTPRTYKKQRGRPRGVFRSYAYLESMVLLAGKHDLDPKQLIDAFFEALKNNVSHCGSLEITCRNVTQDSAAFLVTKEEKVVWQFPVKLEVITSADVRDSITEIPLPEKKIGESGRNLNIDQLRSGMKRVNILAKIIEIPPTREVTTRWGSRASVSNVKIADETGSIRLSLWNDQIKMVNIGDEIEIKNCSAARFANEPQLRLSRKGTISVVNQLQQEEFIKYPISK